MWLLASHLKPDTQATFEVPSLIESKYLKNIRKSKKGLYQCPWCKAEYEHSAGYLHEVFNCPNKEKVNETINGTGSVTGGSPGWGL